MENVYHQETRIYGNGAFPYNIFSGRIPEWFSAYPPHCHESFELIYCKKGSFQVTLCKQAYTLLAGDIMVVLPHTVHSIEQAGTEKGEYYNIVFAPSLFKGDEGDPCYEKYVLPFVNGKRTIECFQPASSGFSKAVNSCIMSLFSHQQNNSSSYELVVKSDLFQLLHTMIEYSIPSDSENHYQHFLNSRLINFLFYIQSHYAEEISIQEAADRCGFSVSYFAKLFKDFTGKSFNSYLIDCRLEMAAKQLVETDYRIIDVAENCGFQNHSYFTRAFRKKYQMTPSMYKKSMIKSIPKAVRP